MAVRYRIVSENCASCGVCVEVCPLGAISEDPYSIDPELCNGCGECAEGCPTEAIEDYEYAPPEPPENIANHSGGMTLSIKVKLE